MSAIHEIIVTRYGVFLALLLFGSVLSSCVPQMVQEGRLRSVQPVFTLESVDEIKTFSSVSGMAKIKVTIGDENFSGDHALFAETPNKLRAELFGLFGQPLYLLVSNAKVLTYLVPGENRYFRSAPSVDSFYRLTRIPLDSSAFVGLLLGRLPAIGAAEFYAETDVDGRYVVTLSGADGRYQELRFNQQGQLVVGRLWRGRQLLLTAEYSDFTAEGFAARVNLDFPLSQVSASIEFDDPTVDGIIPPQRFELTIPENANRIDLNRS